MAQYLSPYPGHKKTVIFQQRERELRHAIKHEVSIQKLHKTAEKLRAAKMYLLKALRKSLETYRAEDEIPIERIRKIDMEAEEWASASVEEILEKYI